MLVYSVCELDINFVGIPRSGSKFYRGTSVELLRLFDSRLKSSSLN